MDFRPLLACNLRVRSLVLRPYCLNIYRSTSVDKFVTVIEFFVKERFRGCPLTPLFFIINEILVVAYYKVHIFENHLFCIGF